MLTRSQLEKIIFFDIETAGLEANLEDLSPRLAELWKKRADYLRTSLSAKYPENASLNDSVMYQNKSALQAEFGRVVCISFGRLKFDESGTPRAQILSYSGYDEPQVLTQAFELMEKFGKAGSKLAGHNIKRFDIPFLCKRAFINKIHPPSSLQVWDMKPWEIPVVDTSELWGFGAWQEGFTSLDLLTAALGIPSPKDEMDGSEVHSNFYNGNILDIQNYCQKDVISLIRVMLALSGENQLDESNITYK